MSYSRGKLNEYDEGDLKIAVGVEQDCVKIIFEKEISWIALPAEQALQLAEAIVNRAKQAMKNRQ